MVASFKISSFHKKQVLDCGLLQQAVPLCAQRPEHARHWKFAVRVLLVGIQSQSLWTSRPVMAAHSCGVLKERFEKTRSLHRHDAEQRVWAVSNKLLQGKGLCIYKDIACKRASAYQNGTTKHCLQKLLHPSELSIPLAAVILDSSKIFQEAVAVTAKQVQIGDRPCRIYGADCAEYLLLQMTDEHELQRMDNEVAAIA